MLSSSFPGTLQATEVVELILGNGDPLVGRLVLVDALASTFCGIPASNGEEGLGSLVPEMSLRELAARTVNSEGGIRAWSAGNDPSVPTY